MSVNEKPVRKRRKKNAKAKGNDSGRIDDGVGVLRNLRVLKPMDLKASTSDPAPQVAYFLGTVKSYRKAADVQRGSGRGRPVKLGVGQYHVKFDFGGSENMLPDEVIACANLFHQQRETELGYQERPSNHVDIVSSFNGEESRRHGIKLLLEHQNWPLHPADLLILDHERREFFSCPDHVMSEIKSPNPVSPIWFTVDGKPASHDNTGEMQRMHLASLAAAHLAEQYTTKPHKQKDLEVKKPRIIKKTKTLSNLALTSYKTIELPEMVEPVLKESLSDHQFPKQNAVGISTGESVRSITNDNGKTPAHPTFTIQVSERQEVMKSPNADLPSLVFGSVHTNLSALQSSISAVKDASLPPKAFNLKSNACNLNGYVVRTNDIKQTSIGEERKTHTIEQGARKFQLKKRDLSNIIKNDITSTQAVSANREDISPPRHTREDRGNGNACQDSMHSAGTPKTGNVLPVAMESKASEICTHPRGNGLDMPYLNDKILQGAGLSIVHAQNSPSKIEKKKLTFENNFSLTDREHPSQTPGVQRKFENEIPESNRPFGCKPSPVQVRVTAICSARMASLTGNDVLSVPSPISQASLSTTTKCAATINREQQPSTEISRPDVIKTIDRQQSVESLGSFNSILSHARSLTPNHRHHDSLSPHGTPSTTEKNYEELDDFMQKVSQSRQSPDSQAIPDRTPKVGESQADRHEAQVSGERSLNPLHRESSDEFPTSSTQNDHTVPKNKIDFMKQNKARKENTSLRKLCGVHIHDHVELYHEDSDQCEDYLSTREGTSFEGVSSVHSHGMVNGNKCESSPHFQGAHAATNQSVAKDSGAQLHRKNGDDTYPQLHQTGNPLHDDAMADWLSGDSVIGQHAPPRGSLYSWQKIQEPPQEALLPNPLTGIYAPRPQHRSCQDPLVLPNQVQSPPSYSEGDRGGPVTRHPQSGHNESRGRHGVNPFGSLHRYTQSSPSRRIFGHPRPGSIHEGTAIYRRHTLTVCFVHTSDVSPVGGNAEEGCDSLLHRLPATSKEDLEIIKYKCSAKNGSDALFVSWKRRLPIRVFRFTSKLDVKGYRYDGLYSVMAVSDGDDKILTENKQSNTCSQFLLRRNETGNLDRDLNTMALDDLWSLINQGEVQEGVGMNEQYHYLGPRGLDLAIRKLSHHGRNGMGQYPLHRDQILQNESSYLLERGPTHQHRAHMAQDRQYTATDRYARHQMDILQQHSMLPPAYFDPRNPVMMDVNSRSGFDVERPQKKSKQMTVHDPRMY